MGFSISVEKADDHDLVVLKLEGPLDSTGTSCLQKKLQHLIQDRHYRLILNCEKVTLLKISAIRLVLHIEHTLKGTKGSLCLCCLPEEFFDLFKVSGFDRLINVAKTEEEAMKESLESASASSKLLT